MAIIRESTVGRRGKLAGYIVIHMQIQTGREARL